MKGRRAAPEARRTRTTARPTAVQASLSIRRCLHRRGSPPSDRRSGAQPLGSEMAATEVVSIAVSALDSGIRPPCNSWLAACTKSRMTAWCQVMGRSLGTRRCSWPRSMSGTSSVVIGRWRRWRWSSFAESRAVLIARKAWKRASCSPGGSEHSLQGFFRLARWGSALLVAWATSLDGVLHDGVEEGFAGREVDVDRGADDACAASDLGHAAVGIARQRVEGGGRMAATLRSASARRRSARRLRSRRRSGIVSGSASRWGSAAASAGSGGLREDSEATRLAKRGARLR